MLAEKYIRLYNQLDGKPATREKLARLHSAIRKEIDAKRIDKHSPLGIELFSIESRLATALASIHGPFDVEEIKVKKIDVDAYIKLATRKAAQASDFILDRKTQEEASPVVKQEVRQVAGIKAKKKTLNGTTPTKVISASTLAGMEFETLPFDGKWKEHLGVPSKNFTAMVWGKPKQGKTHYAFQLANYVSQFGNVLYVLSDEGVGHTVKEKIRQNGLDKNDKVSFIETRQVSEVRKALDSGNFKFVFLDLISNMKQAEDNLTPDQFHALRQDYPGMSFIPVFSSTKNGNFRGTQDWGHDVDVLVDVENGIANAQGRFGGGEYKIFPDPVPVTEKKEPITQPTSV